MKERERERERDRERGGGSGGGVGGERTRREKNRFKGSSDAVNMMQCLGGGSFRMEIVVNC